MLTVDAVFPARLRFYRSALGLTRRELARRTGVTRQALEKWELGKFSSGPTLGNLQALARELGVMVSHLTGELGPLEVPGECQHINRSN